MPTREDQPATVPPPAGEDDAYSATTKVGAMPLQIMEKLRAEGLLPEEVEEEELAKAAERDARLTSARPNSSLEARRSDPPPPSSGAPVPQLFSLPPGAATHTEEEGEVPASKLETAKPPVPVADSTETPVAFAFPPAPQLPQIDEPIRASSDPPKSLAKEPRAATPVKAQKGPSKVVMTIVALLVVVFLIVALIRLRG